MSLPQATIQHAKADIVEVIGRYVELQKKGAEYVACCPFHQEKTPSFTVTPAKGAYYCFGCGAGGDAVSFVQCFEQVAFPEAVRRIVGDAEAGAGSPVQRPSIKAEQAPEWLPVVPVPDNAPAPNFKFSGELPSRSWLYRDANGGRIGYIARFELPGGGKDVRPLSFCVNSSTGEMAWRWLSFSKPRPLYGLDKLAKHPKAQVVIAEGEKSADGAQALYEAAGIPRDKLVVVSWPGGGKAVKHADWSPLAGRSVALWPDADQKRYPDNHPKAGELMSFLEQPGTACMIDIADRLAGVAAVLKFIEPPAGVPDGWDLGDPLPAGFDLLAHTKASALPMADFRAKHGLGAEVVDLGRVRTVREPVAATAAAPAMPQFEEVTEADAPRWLGEELQAQQDQVPETIDQSGELVTACADDLAENQYFTILGTNRKSYFFFQHEKRQVLEYTKSEFTDAGLIELAALNWWEMKFPGPKGGINKNAVVEGIFRTANQRGIYSPDSVRGRGVWIDDGRIVFHLGDRAIIDGTLVDLAALIRSSSYVYEAGERLAYSGERMLTNEEGEELLETACLFSWAERGAGILMAGWTFLAPICGALEWRPHIWLAGPAGTGKSTLQKAYMRKLIGEAWGIYANGSSTEAGIRQDIGSDARPVVVDEAETSADARNHMESVLTLIRQSSSEGGTKTLKGTTSGKALSYQIRSMFCLAAVAPSLTRDTDMDRLTRLEMKKGSDWKTNGLSERLATMDADETLSNRVFTRAMNMLPVVRKAAKVFSAAAGKHFGRQRDGDQFGTLLAGAWCLVKSHVPSEAEAMVMIRGCDWSTMGAGQAVEKDDAKEALSTLLSAHIRVDNRPYSVGQLIEIAAAGQPTYGEHTPDMGPTFSQAVQALGLHGIRLSGSSATLPAGCTGPHVLFCNGHRELIALVGGTDYSIDLIGRLSRVEGAVKSKEGQPGSKVRFASGQPKRYLAIPLETITGAADEYPI